jgi:hypothetical protein
MMRQLVVALLLLASHGCSPAPRAEEGRPRPVVSAEAVANARPDDPRVVCPAGTTQRQHDAFGFHGVWCVDADNHRHGPERRWWSNGKMAADLTYVHGDLDGLSRRWHENGQLASEATYSAGKAEGKVLLWHPNGRKQGESSWRNGELVGAARRWDDKGKPEPVPEE